MAGIIQYDDVQREVLIVLTTSVCTSFKSIQLESVSSLLLLTRGCVKKCVQIVHFL